MFVTNRSPYRVVLAAGSLSENEGCAAIVVESHYRIGEDGLYPYPQTEHVSEPSDPPDAMNHPLWVGVSVTTTASVAPDERTSRLRVSLTVGEQSLELAVFAPRVWVRRGSDLVPSECGRFEPLSLTYEQSFGGACTMPPGLLAGTDMPHPGGTIVYSLNPTGVGFYLDAAVAEGKPLPRVELADQLVKRWNDRPRPGGVAPCPKLVGLRVIPPTLSQSEPKPSYEPELHPMLRLLHHAPGELIFRDVRPGTPIQLTGATPLALRFLSPPSPIDVHFAKAPRGPAGALRSLHIDASRRTVSAVHHHPFMTRSSGPRRITVLNCQAMALGE